MDLDDARKKTDKELAKMERKLTQIYKEAQNDLTEKWNKYMERGEKRLSALRESGDEDKYQDAVKSYTLRNDRYKDMVDQTTTRLAKVNDIALAYVNDQMPSLYSINYNQAKETADQAGINFNLVDEATVKRLVRDGDIKLPKKKVKIPKDKQWNTKQLNSSVLQGIMQGESMDCIAKRILPIVDNNKNAAIRNARTMVTGAENHGRLDSYKQLQDDGLVLNKVWMATPDGRTRDWHLEMDGQEVGVNEYFVDGLGNELEYPGDPMGAPESVYNCRCAMTTHVIGFRNEDGSIRMIDYETEGESLHESQMDTERSRRSKDGQPVTPVHVIVQGKDITGTWKRRFDEFDFEIEDVINAQGFDGLPRVVSAEEFEKCVREANGWKGLIMQRTYSAPDQETLDAYRQQLYEGKWYVDCSTGGSQYGQGMYTAADYNGVLSKGISDEMKHYQILGSDRLGEISSNNLNLIVQNQKNTANEILNQYKNGELSKDIGVAEYRRVNSMNPSEYLATYMKDSNIEGARSYTETMTLDPSANIIEYSDARKMMLNSDTEDVDMGVFASKLGYDAINAVGHGESGSYTVVLNRTKLIIKGE